MEQQQTDRERAQEAQAQKAAKAFRASDMFWQCEKNEDGYYMGYLDALQEQETNGWISVLDRKPEDLETVLVFCPEGISRCIYTAQWWEKTNTFCTGVGLIPTHWMPLPAEPIAHHSGKQTEEEKEQELKEVIQSLRDKSLTETNPEKKAGLNLMAIFLEHPGKS